EVRIVLEPGQPGDGAQSGELRIGADSDHHVAVAGRKVLVGNQVRVRVAGALLCPAADQVVHGLIRQAGHLHIEQSQVDVLADSRAFAVRERRQYSDRRVQSGQNIGDGDAGFLRPGAGLVVPDRKSTRLNSS